MGSIRVDGLVEREIRRCGVECLVQSRERGRIGPSKSSNPLLEVALALSRRNGRTWAVVVVEGLQR